jgi:ribosomal protein S18 acetylase RimI-like enzyme
MEIVNTFTISAPSPSSAGPADPTVVPGLPAGFSSRRPTVDDLQALHALCCADETGSIGQCATSLGEVAQSLTPPHTTLQDDQWLVCDAAGTPVAWGQVWDAGNTDHQDVDLYRDPTRADESVREALLDRLLLRLAERATLSGYARVDVAAGCYREDAAYAATLRSRGFRHDRTFHRMRIDLDPATQLDVPDLPGVELSDVDPADEAAFRELHAVVEEGFSRHWGYVPVTYSDYRAEFDADPVPDVPMWRLARVDGRLVGVCKASGRNADVGGGYVADLCVLDGYRGRGIARALLLSTFEAYRRTGRDHVQLNVDSENDTGAVRLYASVGMREERAIHAYRRDVLPA